MHKTCFFIGHRGAPKTVQTGISAAIEQCISEYGVTFFVVGQYGGFDRMAAQSVIAAKERHPKITIMLLLPYHPAGRPVKTQPGFDGTYYPEGMERSPKRPAIVRANRYMVDNSYYLIAYAWNPASNARELPEYAQARERRGLIRVIELRIN